MLKRITPFIIFSFLISCTKDHINPPLDTPNPSLDTPIVLTIKTINPSGYLQQDGSMDLTVAGGSKPYTILWQKNNPYNSNWRWTTEDIHDLTAGTYYINVTDNKGISKIDTVFLVTNDTIFPKEYLPVYPGSYWIYSNNDTMKVSEDYVKCGLKEFLSPYNPENYWINDSVYIPIWNNKAILEYTYPSYVCALFPLAPLINENWGEIIVYTTDNRHFSCSMMTVKIDTPITINEMVFEDVVMTIDGTYWGGYCPPFPDAYDYLTKYYYAKNVGLIREEQKNPGDTAYTVTKEIVDWSIYNKK